METRDDQHESLRRAADTIGMGTNSTQGPTGTQAGARSDRRRDMDTSGRTARAPLAQMLWAHDQGYHPNPASPAGLSSLALGGLHCTRGMPSDRGMGIRIGCSQKHSPHSPRFKTHVNTRNQNFASARRSALWTLTVCPNTPTTKVRDVILTLLALAATFAVSWSAAALSLAACNAPRSLCHLDCMMGMARKGTSDTIGTGGTRGKQAQ